MPVVPPAIAENTGIFCAVLSVKFRVYEVLRDGVLHENQAGGIRRGKIADGRQRSNRVVARTPLGIAGGGSGAGLHDAIAVRQSLDGLVRDSGGIGRALYGRAIESAKAMPPTEAL